MRIVVRLKRKGLWSVKHTERISKQDLQLIGNLQLKACFVLQYHFALRGMENTYEMDRNSLVEEQDEDGRNIIYLKDQLTKT